jgi:small subunit ribosomal protein S10
MAAIGTVHHRQASFMRSSTYTPATRSSCVSITSTASIASRPAVGKRTLSPKQGKPTSIITQASAAEKSPVQQKIRIKLKSYWVDLLHDAVDKIQEAASSTNATIAGPVPLPTK